MAIVTNFQWPPVKPWPNWTIPQMFEATVARFPDRNAIVSERGRVTYRELAADVHRFAHALLELGVGPGDKVGLWLPNFPEWVVVNLAIAEVRAITVPLNARLRGREVAHVLQSADICVLITTDSFLSNNYLDILEALIPEVGGVHGGVITSRAFPALRHVIGVREPSRPWAIGYETLMQPSDPGYSDRLAKLVASADVNEPVDMFWTSGSTGSPKGAVISHTVLENIWNYSQIFGYSEADRCVVPTPLFYGTGHYWCMLVALMKGASMVLLLEFTPSEVLSAVEREQATTLVGSPTTFLGYVRELEGIEYEIDSLRLAWTGGSNLSLELARKIKSQLHVAVLSQVYGMTELAGIATISPPSDSVELAAGSVGFALPNFELKLVNQITGVPSSHGPGELWARSHMIAVTYYGMTAAELATYFTEDGWYRTGDLLQRDASGRYYFRGRLKDIIKVAGENVTSSEVEDVLGSHPAVHQVVAFGVPDAKRTEVVAAVIEANAPVTEAELREYCRTRLAPFKVPRHFIFRSVLPMTATGKIAKADLKAEIVRELS